MVICLGCHWPKMSFVSLHGIGPHVSHENTGKSFPLWFSSRPMLCCDEFLSYFWTNLQCRKGIRKLQQKAEKGEHNYQREKAKAEKPKKKRPRDFFFNESTDKWEKRTDGRAVGRRSEGRPQKKVKKQEGQQDVQERIGKGKNIVEMIQYWHRFKVNRRTSMAFVISFAFT